MIRFKVVRYRNFLSTGNLNTEIRLDEYKNTLVVGENGAGKSTVLEAISFALYGKTMRSINKSQVINSITQRNLMTEIEFVVGSREYLVRRGMKPNVFEIHVDGKLMNQDAASRDYQEVLEGHVLKLNHKAFSQIDVLSIANYTPFMKLPAAGRREVIEDLLDIQVFSVMNALLKDRVNANKNDLTAVDYEIKLVENKIDVHKRHVEEMNQDHEETIKDKKDQIKKYEKEIVTLNLLVRAHTGELSRLGEKIEAAKKVQERLAKVRSNRSLVASQKEKIVNAIVFLNENDTCPTCKQTMEPDHKEAEIAKKTRLIDEADKALAQLEKNTILLEEDIADLPENKEQVRRINNSASEDSAKITSNARFIASLKTDVRALEAKIKKSQDDDHRLDALQDELNTSTRKKEALIKDREVYSLASQLLKDGGIKTRIIKQYVPVINRLINKYLAALEFFVEFSLDETFQETIKSRFRDAFSYDSFSQGEKLRIDLALLFTWRAVAKLRNSSSTNLLFMDEILDSSLDTGGVDEFLKIISSLTNDTNCFIISHRGDQIADRFDHVIRFEKVKSFSKVAA